jgi:DNA-binding SARP family transcriptional activator
MASMGSALAARQYEACRELLAGELGIAPLEETQTLYAQIIAVAGSRQDMVEGDESANLQQFRQALEGFGAAREHLQRAIQRVERLAKDE